MLFFSKRTHLIYLTVSFIALSIRLFAAENLPTAYVFNPWQLKIDLKGQIQSAPDETAWIRRISDRVLAQSFGSREEEIGKIIQKSSDDYLGLKKAESLVEAEHGLDLLSKQSLYAKLYDQASELVLLSLLASPVENRREISRRAAFFVKDPRFMERLPEFLKEELAKALGSENFGLPLSGFEKLYVWGREAKDQKFLAGRYFVQTLRRLTFKNYWCDLQQHSHCSEVKSADLFESVPFTQLQENILVSAPRSLEGSSLFLAIKDTQENAKLVLLTKERVAPLSSAPVADTEIKRENLPRWVWITTGIALAGLTGFVVYKSTSDNPSKVKTP